MAIKNVVDLQRELSEVFDNLKTGNINLNTASELNNTAGKLINSVRTQLEYCKLTKEKANVPFLSSGI